MATKTRKTLERQARDFLRRAGNFQGQGSQVYTFCPHRSDRYAQPCGDRVEGVRPYGERGWRGVELALIPSLADHWEDCHGGEGA